MRKGGRLIAQGSYGCVNRPPLKCVRDPYGSVPDYAGKVSKVMRRRDALKELSEYKNIERVDPEHYFHPAAPTMCEPDLDSHEAQTLGLCEVFNTRNDSDEFEMLLMLDGGTDLTALDWSKINVRAFLLELNRLFMGVELFVNSGYAHTDIKPNNIVYDPATNRINFIDFGLMQTLSVLGSDKSLIKNIWYHHPLEYQLVRTLGNGGASVDDVLEHVAAQNTQFPVDTLVPEYEGLLTEVYVNKTKRKQAEHICLRTYDSYQLGLVILYVLTMLKHRIRPAALHDAIFELGYSMCRINVFYRMDIQTAIHTYESILNQFVLVGEPTEALVSVVDHLSEIPTTTVNSIYSNIPSSTLRIPQTWTSHVSPPGLRRHGKSRSRSRSRNSKSRKSRSKSDDW
jgi:serine/threonine protein kinase